MNKIPFILLIGTVASCFQEETVEEKTVPYQTEKYESGQLKASYEVFADGTKNGRYKSFHENGEEESEGKYVNGKREGKWWFHDDQGNFTYFGFYEDDARVGEWTSYSQEHPKKYGIGLDDGKLAEWTVDEGMSSQGVVVIGQGYSDEFGVRVAAWTWRYENGQVESYGKYWYGDRPASHHRYPPTLL